MPTVVFNKKDVLKLIGKPVTDERLREAIPDMGVVLEKLDDEIHLELFPNRPDLLSLEGFARYLSSFLGIKTGLKEYKVNNSKYKFVIENKVKKIRPCAAACVVKNVDLRDNIDQLMQLQEKLHATHGRNRKKVSIGVYDLDKIKFPLRYTAKDFDFSFTPLEMKREMTLSNILEMHPKGQEFKHLLEGFKEYPVWIDDDDKVLSMPPIINSEETKITEETKNLFVDCTGTDQEAVELALNIIATGFSDRGSDIFKVNNFPNLNSKKMKLDERYLEKIAGVKINGTKKLLENMGYGFKNNLVLIPCYRADILHQIDLVEDVIIAYGFNNLKYEIPNITTGGEENKTEVINNKIAEVLIGIGLIEVSTYHITSMVNQKEKMKSEIDLIEIENPLSNEFNVLRAWLIPNLLDVFKNNKHSEYPQKIFEIGRIFSKEKEPYRLGIGVSHTTANYTEARQILDALFSALNMRYEIKEMEHESFIKGRAAGISVNGRNLGFMGEVHPGVLANFGLEMPTSVLEIDLGEILQNPK